MGPDVEPAPQRTDNQSYAQAATEVGSAAIRGMAPAERGWILASVILMLGAIALIEVTSYMEVTAAGERTAGFITTIEQNRAEENRRLQEQNRILAQALARQSDRIGRKAAEESVLKSAKEIHTPIQ